MGAIVVIGEWVEKRWNEILESIPEIISLAES